MTSNSRKYLENLLKSLILILLLSLIFTLSYASRELRGKLVLSSYPWPCRVILDGYEVGTTGVKPFEVELSPGTHLLKLIYNPDYEVYEKGIVIQANRVLKLYVKLQLSDWGKYKRALKHYSKGEYKKTIYYLKDLAVSKKPSHPSKGGIPSEVYFYLGASYLRIGQPNKAGYWLKRYIKLEPQSVKARVLLAKAKADLGYPDQAIKDLEQALEGYPFLKETYRSFGELLNDLSKKELREVRRSLLDYLKHMQGEDRVLYLLKLALVSKKVGDIKGAYNYLYKALCLKLGDVWKP